MNTYYFYKITNTINDDVYIGSTTNPKERWWRHRTDGRSNKNKVCIINIHMRELGMDNFNFNVIEFGEYSSKQLAYQREDDLMIEYNSINRRCASKQKQLANSKLYDKEYNNKQSTKDAKVKWNADNREKVNRNQIEANKRYIAKNKERLAYNRVIKYELDNYGKTAFDFTLFT